MQVHGRLVKVTDMKTALAITFFLQLLLSVTSVSAFCFEEAGARYQISPLVLYAIAKQESSFNPNARNINANGTYDFSIMQINSSHLDELAAMGISEQDLIKNSCQAVYVGAWYLARNMNEFKGKPDAFWSAIGAYNAGTGKKVKNQNKRMDYAWLIYKRMAAVKNEN